jgi:hypothetical protein
MHTRHAGFGLAALHPVSAKVGAIACASLAVSLLLNAPAAQAQEVFEDAGAAAADIQDTVSEFRVELGDPDNIAQPDSQGAGRREINWDGVPDGDAAPGRFPGDFFNVVSPRGAVFTDDGATFQVSADAANPAGAGVEFANLNPTYSTAFATFSPERLFTSLGSNVFDVEFFIPGGEEPAAVRGFGAVFTDVDRSGSTIEYFRGAQSLGVFEVPALAGDGSRSFLGVTFENPIVTKVRITLGEAPLLTMDSPNDVTQGGGADLVVLDDFLYGEPVPVDLISRLRGLIAATSDAVLDQRLVNLLRLARRQTNRALGASGDEQDRGLNQAIGTLTIYERRLARLSSDGIDAAARESLWDEATAALVALAEQRDQP